MNRMPMPVKRKSTAKTSAPETVAAREAAVAQAWIDLETVMGDLREANGHLVLANLRSQELASEVRRLYEEATSAIEAKDAFFEQVSHELRTPMTSISGWASLLGIQADPETISEAARAIAGSAAIQAKLVNDLLDVSRIMTRKFDVTLIETDLRKTVDEAVIAMRPAAMAKGISLSLSGEQGILIDGDPLRLRQVLDNLLSNAVKFTHTDGVIHVSVTRAGRDAVLEVRDNGEGILPDFLPHVFKRHAQAASGRFGGLGLGLAIVKHIVELHGGTVVAESAGPGSGATFTVRIPVAR